MNLIPKICELLGVEIGEAFKIKGVDNEIFKFEGTGLFTKTENGSKSIWCLQLGTIFRDLLVGVAKIEKLPFEPKDGEQYWFIGLYDEKPTVMHTIWNSADMTHYERKYSGNVFRGFDDSHKMQYEIYERLTGRKWEE